MSNEDSYFAESVKRLRKELGISQEEFATIIGVGKTTVSNYESGYATPPIATLKKMMSAFQLPASYFINQSEINKKDIQNFYGISIPFFKCTNIEGILSRDKTQMDSNLTLPSQVEYTKNKCIATTVPDNSMNRCGMKRGNCIVIDLEAPMLDGCIIAAIYRGELVIRRYHKDISGDYISMESTKVPAGMSSERIPENNFEILGVVSKIILDARNL